MFGVKNRCCTISIFVGCICFFTVFFFAGFLRADFCFWVLFHLIINNYQHFLIQLVMTWKTSYQPVEWLVFIRKDQFSCIVVRVNRVMKTQAENFLSGHFLIMKALSPRIHKTYQIFSLCPFYLFLKHGNSFSRAVNIFLS